jgi:hypothetical protein
MSQLSPSDTPRTTSQYGSDTLDGSSLSSRTSSPDPNNRRDSNNLKETTPQMNFLQKQKEIRDKENSQVRLLMNLICFNQL